MTWGCKVNENIHGRYWKSLKNKNGVMHLDKEMIFSQYVHNFFHSMLNLADMCENKDQED